MHMSLSGHRILVTRPAHQAEALCTALVEAGAEVTRLPLIEILPATPAHLPAVNGYDWLIFTSPNAVHHGLPLLQSTGGWPQLAAVGAATASALQNAGHAQVLRPARQFSSEGLLALPEFSNPEDLRILLIKGIGGRDLLSQTLKERSARVEVLEVYQRQPLSPSNEDMRRAITTADAAIVTSGEILQRLRDLCPKDLLKPLKKMQLVVPSDRVVKMAQTLGFLNVLEVPSPLSNENLVQALRMALPAVSTGHNA